MKKLVGFLCGFIIIACGGDIMGSLTFVKSPVKERVQVYKGGKFSYQPVTSNTIFNYKMNYDAVRGVPDNGPYGLDLGSGNGPFDYGFPPPRGLDYAVKLGDIGDGGSLYRFAALPNVDAITTSEDLYFSLIFFTPESSTASSSPTILYVYGPSQVWALLLQYASDSVLNVWVIGPSNYLQLQVSGADSLLRDGSWKHFVGYFPRDPGVSPSLWVNGSPVEYTFGSGSVTTFLDVGELAAGKMTIFVSGTSTTWFNYSPTAWAEAHLAKIDSPLVYIR